MSRPGKTSFNLRTTDDFWDRVAEDAEARHLTIAQHVSEVLRQYIADGGDGNQDPELLTQRMIRVDTGLFEQARTIASATDANLSEAIRRRLATKHVR